MSDFILTACSTADLPKEYFSDRNIPYISFHFNLEGKEYKDDLGQTISFKDFYKKIENGAMPTTSQVNIGEFINFFESYLKEGKDILHISFSSGLSGTYNSSIMARDQLLSEYPERKILIVDSLGASSGYGLLLDGAADMRDQGASMEDIYNWLEANKLKLHHWFFSTDLTHYKRGGRISPTAAFVGGILNICPLLNMNKEGELTQRETIHGKKKVVVEIVKKMKDNADNRQDYTGKCFISHSASYEDARALADLIEEEFPKLNGKVMINNVGTVIGSHTGPGTVALFFFGKKRED